MSTRIGPAPRSSPPFVESRSSPALHTPATLATARAHHAGVTAPTHPALPAEVGGYRVVRLLALGSRACTVLMHAAEETRVARLFSISCTPSLIDGELAVHDAVRESAATLRDHAVELDDLVTLSDGRLALLFGHVGGPPLDEVLTAHRGRLTLGEAVTILAPLVSALDAAHAAGITGIGLRAADIRFSTAGAPVLTRLHGAVVGPILPERFRALEADYLADTSAFARLCVVVSSSVSHPDRAALDTALQAPTQGRSLAHALFDLAPPTPVRIVGLELANDLHADSIAADSESVDVPQVPSALAGVDPVRLPDALQTAVDTLRLLGMPSTVVTTIEAAAHRVVGVWRRLVARGNRFLPLVTLRFRGVRPRFVLSAAAGAAALVVAIVLMAGSGGAADAGDTAMNGDTGQRSDSHDPASADPAQSVPAQSAAESVPHPEPEQWQAIVETLVIRWMDCRSALGPSHESGCVREVVHDGSAAELLIMTEDPRHELLERWSALSGDAVVVERMGAAVLIDLVTAGTTTASLLVVRSEAGWRVRDVIG